MATTILPSGNFPESINREKLFYLKEVPGTYGPSRVKNEGKDETLKESRGDKEEGEVNCSLLMKNYCLPYRYKKCPFCNLKSKILIILKEEMPQATPELGDILDLDTNKVRPQCYKLKKEGWLTSRKLSSGKALNLFPITMEIVTRWNRERIYTTIYNLIMLIRANQGNTVELLKKLKKFFREMLISANKKQKIQVRRFLLELIESLTKNGVEDALYKVSLIPFPPKTLYWNINLGVSKGELDEFLNTSG